MYLIELQLSWVYTDLMDNNLPNDPSNPNQNNNNNSTPDPFGSNFNPHTNPVDPNNPYRSQPPQIPTPPAQPQPPVSYPPHPSVHSELAQHRPRDAEGHFLPFEHPTNSSPQAAPTAQTPPDPSTPSHSSFLPPLIEVSQIISLSSN